MCPSTDAQTDRGGPQSRADGPPEAEDGYRSPVAGGGGGPAPFLPHRGSGSRAAWRAGRALLPRGREPRRRHVPRAGSAAARAVRGHSDRLREPRGRGRQSGCSSEDLGFRARPRSTPMPPASRARPVPLARAALGSRSPATARAAAFIALGGSGRRAGRAGSSPGPQTPAPGRPPLARPAPGGLWRPLWEAQTRARRAGARGQPSAAAG